MIPTQITANGCEVPSAVRAKAAALAQRWPRFDPAVMEVGIVFRLDGRDRLAEAVVGRRRRRAIIAKGRAADFRVALDQLDSHVSRMLRKDREKRKDVRVP